MVRFENDCVDCGLPCLGEGCPNRNVRHFYCDNCKSEVTKLFVYKDEQWCEECITDDIFNELEVIQ